MKEIIPLSAHETAIKGGNLMVRINYAELTAAGNTQTIQLFTAKAKDTVKLVRMELVTPFVSSDGTLLSTSVTVGDDGGVAVYLAATELNLAGTEIFGKGGVMTNSTQKTLTADDTVDLIITGTVAKLLNTHTAGELVLYFDFYPYARD